MSILSFHYEPNILHKQLAYTLPTTLLLAVDTFKFIGVLLRKAQSSQTTTCVVTRSLHYTMTTCIDRGHTCKHKSQLHISLTASLAMSHDAHYGSHSFGTSRVDQHICKYTHKHEHTCTWAQTWSLEKVLLSSTTVHTCTSMPRHPTEMKSLEIDTQ